MAPPAPITRATAETEVLDSVRALLRDLGASDALERVSLRSALDRDLGLGSLERVELLVRIESALGTRLPETGAQAAETPGDWVRLALAARNGSVARDRWRIVQPSKEAYQPPAEASTFAQVLSVQTERDPARIHIHLLDGDHGQDIRHGQLCEAASRVATGLVSSGLRHGDTVAIMLPTGEDFFTSFLGVMLAGGISVPIYPPARPNQVEEYIRRQSLILKNAEARFLITFDRVRAVANVLQRELPTLREIVDVGELVRRGGRRSLPVIDPPDTFFIQYTSGSTGDPKGVTLTHSNVLANIRGIGFAVQVRPTDAVVSWLPLYHDMGLIGSWLFSLYHGLPITILSPLDFLVRPERWLWALSDSRATLCPAPNFAFELCVRKIADEAMNGIDLSQWRVAINAGEPVLPATLERFARRFGPWGFDARSFMPFYGLAESSVALTYPPFWRGPLLDRIDRQVFESEGRAVRSTAADAREFLEFVGNGKALPGHEIRIVGDSGEVLPDRVRGRIEFRGPSRTNGYFRNPDATAEVLDGSGWLDSGDLGYVADGELFVTGRLKDCIIKGGHNIIPQDVEMAAWDAEGVRKGCVAAFGSLDAATGTERLVVVAETRLTEPGARVRLQAAVTDAVARKVGIPPDEVVPVRPGCVPKTSSGKIQRRATRHLYESGAVAGWRSTATWVQVARVGGRSATLSCLRSVTQWGRQARCAAAAALGSLVAGVFGMAARLAPTPTVARFLISPGARLVVALSGTRVRGRMAANRPRMVLVSRSGPLDPLAVAGAFRSAFVFADRIGFRSLGAASAFLLEPLVASGPPGGYGPSPSVTNGDAIAGTLASGVSVVSFADNPAAESPGRTRFRADCFAGAASAGVPLVPVVLRETDRRTLAVIEGSELEAPKGLRQLARSRMEVRSVLAATAGMP